MFAFFETRIRPTALPRNAPPSGLLAFYWHFIRQTRRLYAAMFVTGLAVALIDTLIPVFIGKLVTLMQAAERAVAFHAATPMLLGMAAIILFGRPLTLLADSLVRNNAVVPGVTNLIRWQSHWHVVRQTWPFFQNDFAGRIANGVHADRQGIAGKTVMWHTRGLLHRSYTAAARSCCLPRLTGAA